MVYFACIKRNMKSQWQVEQSVLCCVTRSETCCLRSKTGLEINVGTAAGKEEPFRGPGAKSPIMLIASRGACEVEFFEDPS